MNPEPDAMAQLWKVRPLGNAETRAELERVAAADNHSVILPTHVVTKQGTIAGYASVLPVTLLNVWVDSRTVRARESLELLNFGENLAVNLCGPRPLLTPCAEISPFYGLMEKLGYARLGPTTLHVKGS